MNNFDAKNAFLTKWQLFKLNIFYTLLLNTKGCVCALIVHIHGNQLVPDTFTGAI